MLILLPPSEGKSPAPAHREPVELSLLHHGQLTAARQQVLDVLAQVSALPDALEILKVGQSLVEEVERNTRLLDEPAADASAVYSGVLYEALDYDTLTVRQQEQADQHLLIVSALWGLVHLDDVIPAYRLSMGTRLGELGVLSTYWKKQLQPVFEEDFEPGLVLDCRSSAYQKALPTDPASTYEVKAVSRGQDGGRKVISHMAKHHRGLVTRYIITENLAESDDIETVVTGLRCRWEVEVTEPAGKKPGAITLVIPA